MCNQKNSSIYCSGGSGADSQTNAALSLLSLPPPGADNSTRCAMERGLLTTLTHTVIAAAQVTNQGENVM